MKKRVGIVVGLLLILAGLLCLVVWLGGSTPTPLPEVEQRVAEAVTGAVASPSPAASVPGTSAGGETPAPYVSPVDFAALQAGNEDIYAWLYIPGTGINYPLLQNGENDELYLDHDSQGEYASKGALFTQSEYNNRDFTDPVTVIYGHHMRSGEMFGNLQALYSDEGGLVQYRDIYIYLPNEEQRYAAFAAVPFDGYHLLYYNDFSDSEVYQKFLDKIYAVRAIGANFDEENLAAPEDQVIILSTCLSGNNQRRYLVLAKRIDDRTTTP